MDTSNNSSKRAASGRPRTERSEVAPEQGRKPLSGSSSDLEQGIEPGNTIPCNSITLRQAVDSLYLSFQGTLFEERAIRLNAAQQSARSTDDSNESQAQISVLDHSFEVAPAGSKFYKYRLSDHAYSIQLKALNGPKTVPLAYVEIRSGHLMTVGVEQAVSQLRLILAFFGVVEGPAHISRIDLCADFVTPHKMHLFDTLGWVTRADNIDPHLVKGEFTGWNIGRSGMSARVYDKTAEIKVSGKLYMLPVWRECGWDGSSPVTRAEFQFRSDVLKQFGCVNFPDVMEKLGGLWFYASNDWCRLTIPNDDDQTKSRWPTHPLWEHVQRVEWNDALPLTRVAIPVSSVPSDTKLYRAFFSSLTSFMAARQLLDPEDACRALFYESREHYNDREEFQNADFFDQARFRAAKKALGYGAPFAESTEEAQRKQDEAVADDLRAKANEYRKLSGR